MSDYEQNEGYIRKRFRNLDGAYAEYISAAPVRALGHFELTVGTTPVGLPSVPADAKRVVIYAFTNALTFTDDGTNPSASHGMPIPADTHFVYDTDPSDAFKMRAASSADVRVAYYG